MDPVMRLSASDLVCIRGSREIFADLSFTLGAGEALVVRGPNGVGKSSLLRLIAGLIRIAAGRLALDGGHPELTIAEQSHYLGHQDALKPALSVTENILFWASYLGSGGMPWHDALAGSSSNQIGRSTARSRATDRRRRWPADR